MSSSVWRTYLMTNADTVLWTKDHCGWLKQQEAMVSTDERAGKGSNE